MVDHDILLDRLNTLDVLYGSVLDTLRLSRLYACPTADISLLSSCDSAGHVLPMIYKHFVRGFLSFQLLSSLVFNLFLIVLTPGCFL